MSSVSLSTTGGRCHIKENFESWSCKDSQGLFCNLSVNSSGQPPGTIRLDTMAETMHSTTKANVSVHSVEAKPEYADQCIQTSEHKASLLDEHDLQSYAQLAASTDLTAEQGCIHSCSLYFLRGQA